MFASPITLYAMHVYNVCTTYTQCNIQCWNSILFAHEITMCTLYTVQYMQMLFTLDAFVTSVNKQ